MKPSDKTPTSPNSSATPTSPDDFATWASNHLTESYQKERERHRPRRSVAELKKLILEFFGKPSADSPKQG